MPWCGYHPAMEAGVQQFGKGLVAAIQARANRMGVPVSELANMEQTELEAFSDALGIVPGGSKKIALEGLTNFVRGVVTGAVERMSQDGIAFDAALDKEVHAVSDLIEPLEKEFQTLSNQRDSGTFAKLANWAAAQ